MQFGVETPFIDIQICYYNKRIGSIGSREDSQIQMCSYNNFQTLITCRMKNTNQDCLSIQMKRYLRIPQVDSNQELKQLISKYITDQPQGFLKKKSQSSFDELNDKLNQKQPIKKQDIASSDDTPEVIQKSKGSSDSPIINKQANLKDLRNIKSKISINQKIIQTLTEHKRILLAGVLPQDKDKQTICGYLLFPPQQHQIPINQIQEAFERQGRRIIGVGLQVQNSKISTNELLQIQKLIQNNFYVLVMNNKQNNAMTLLYTKDIKGSAKTNNQILFQKQSEFVQVIAKTTQIEQLINRDENYKTKIIKTKSQQKKQQNSPLKTDGKNVIKLFQYKFAASLKVKAGKNDDGWGFVFYPQNGVISKYTFLKSFQDMQTVMNRKEYQDPIPIQRFGHPKGTLSKEFLIYLWKHQISFAGIANSIYNIVFFRVIQDPSNQGQILYGSIQTKKLDSIVCVATYTTKNQKTVQIAQMKPELV